VIAGPGKVSDLWAGNLPKGVELRNRLIPDAEAVDLFRRCGLLVMPYINATQSALIASAYYFRKPVLVTRTGALPESVEDGQTGCVVEPGHPATLARRLSEMLEDPAALARMGVEGRAWYDSRRVVEGQTLVAMYRRMAGKYRGETAPPNR
jgi:glycosyltransferase involved in cell wall biosynthesis